MAINGEQKRLGKAERDLVALGIAIAAIILFVGTGGTVLPDVVAVFSSSGSGPDRLLVNAMLLNIALIIFGWRRYRQLTEEIAERRNAEERARQLSEIDPLTGCLNRRSLTGATEKLRRDASARGEITAFAMIDLDNFKQINDVHGHTTGDKVLAECSRRISELLPKDAILARLGGDEFAFVVPFDGQRTEFVENLVERLIDSIGAPIDVEGMSVRTTISIGIASDRDSAASHEEHIDAETLMHRADIAMYNAKNSGKNRGFWFEPAMETEIRFRNELEAGMRAGMALGEFVPFYEQQVDVDTGRLLGFEMLARWHSPNLGLVGPEIFIPIAEESGMIGELSEQLMAQAFQDALTWDDHLTLSVNISPCQLRDPWFAQKLVKLMVAHDFPAHRFEIDIAERCLQEHFGLVSGVVTSLRAQGIKISLDDFGTGYASLDQLRALPFDRIKIDRRFIRELRGAESGAGIIDAMVSLGRGLDMSIIAEGIEDQEILDKVRRIGSVKGQGYIYGKPETAEQVLVRLKALRASGHDMLVGTTGPGDADRAAADAPASIEEHTGGSPFHKAANEDGTERRAAP